MSDRLLAGNLRTYAELVAALRTRVEERRIPLNSEELHSVAGLPDRYLPKVLGPAGAAGTGKRLGSISFDPVLAVLGVKLALIEDDEAMARLRGRIPVSDTARSRAIVQVHNRAKLRENGRLGGHAAAVVTRNKAAERERCRLAMRRKRERDRLRQIGE